MKVLYLYVLTQAQPPSQLLLQRTQDRYRQLKGEDVRVLGGTRVSGAFPRSPDTSVIAASFQVCQKNGLPVSADNDIAYSIDVVDGEEIGVIHIRIPGPDLRSGIAAKATSTSAPRVPAEPAKDPGSCGYCGKRFEGLRQGFYTDTAATEIGDTILRTRKGCDKCGIPVCFDCAAEAADKKGMKGHCACPRCGANLD